MTQWFGDPWLKHHDPGSPKHVPTPVGVVCLHCGEPVVEGERGEVMGAVVMEDGKAVSRIAYSHAECGLRMAVGGPAHLLGTCSCQGGTDDPDLAMGSREAAWWVWERLGYGERKVS